LTHCRWFHYDLDLPLTSLSTHEDVMSLPAQITEPSVEGQQIYFYFLALISIHKLVSSIHSMLYEGNTSTISRSKIGDATETNLHRP
jgi:hypothetical protein